MLRLIQSVSVSSMLLLMTATNSIAAPLDAGSFSPEVQRIEVQSIEIQGIEIQGVELQEVKDSDRPEAYEPPPDIGAPKRTGSGSGRYV